MMMMIIITYIWWLRCYTLWTIQHSIQRTMYNTYTGTWLYPIGIYIFIFVGILCMQKFYVGYTIRNWPAGNYEHADQRMKQIQQEFSIEYAYPNDFVNGSSILPLPSIHLHCLYGFIVCLFGHMAFTQKPAFYLLSQEKKCGDSNLHINTYSSCTESNII